MVKSESESEVAQAPWTVADQTPPRMDFSRQGSGVGGHLLLQGNSGGYGQ